MNIPPEKPVDALPQKGQRKAVFPVSGGDVTFIFPEGLSPDSWRELEAYSGVLLKYQRHRVFEETKTARAALNPEDEA